MAQETKGKNAVEEQEGFHPGGGGGGCIFGDGALLGSWAIPSGIQGLLLLAVCSEIILGSAKGMEAPYPLYYFARPRKDCF